MLASAYNFVLRVRMPFLYAALSALCSMFSIVRHVVGLISVRSGAAYVYLVRSSVVYKRIAIRGGMFGCVLNSCLSWLIMCPDVLVTRLICCWSVICVSRVAPNMVMFVCLGIVVF